MRRFALKLLKLCVAIAVLSLVSISCRPIPTNADESNDNPNIDLYDQILSVSDVLNLEPEQIDIVDVCFMLETETGWGDNTQRARANLILQEIERKVARQIRSYDNGERRVFKLVNSIFESGFLVDKDDPEGHNPENLYLSSVITRRKGYCVSLSFVALAIAQRLRLNRNIFIPIQGVRAPKHFFVRYVSKDKGLEKNYEMTNYGANRNKFDYLNALGLPLAYVNLKPYFKALDNKQIFSDLINNVGANNILASNYKEALNWLKIASNFDPGNPQPLYNQAYIYEHQEDFTQSISFLNQAIKLDPNFYEARTARGKLYCDLGNPTEGLKDFEFVIDNYKYRHEAFLMRGVYFAKNADYKAALTDLKRAEKLSPYDKDTNMNLLNLYLRQNMLADAAPIAEKLEHIAPDDPQVRKLLEIFAKANK